jgi:ferredoxin-thioredoxin reductase catalytic subunit
MTSDRGREHAQQRPQIDVAQFVHNVAKRRNWQLPADSDFLSMLIEGLEGNLERLGYLQCPCRLSWDDKEKDKDIVCPCIYAEADIAEYGHCYCSLFFSSDYDTANEEMVSIPERRPQHLFP